MRTPIVSPRYTSPVPTTESSLFPAECPACAAAKREAAEWYKAFIDLYNACMALSRSDTAIVRVEIVVNKNIMNFLEPATILPNVIQPSELKYGGFETRDDMERNG